MLLTRAWCEPLLKTLGSNLGCPVCPQHCPCSLCHFHVLGKAWLCRSHTAGSFQEQISISNSCILGAVGPWGDLGSCLVGVPWLNSAVSFCSEGRSLGLIALQVHRAWNEVFKNPHMICSGSRDQHPNTLRHLAYFFFSSGRKDFKYYPKPLSICQKILSLGNAEQNQTLTKLLNLLPALGFTAIPLTQVWHLVQCRTIYSNSKELTGDLFSSNTGKKRESWDQLGQRIQSLSCFNNTLNTLQCSSVSCSRRAPRRGISLADWMVINSHSQKYIDNVFSLHSES